MISISVIAGLVPMLAWGVADFLQSINIRKLGVAKSMFLSNLIGLLPLVFFLGFEESFVISLSNLVLVLIAGVVQVIAIANFFRSLEIGELAIVSPISASFPVVSVILLVIFLNTKLSFLSIIAIGMLVLGIMLTSTDLRRLRHIREAKGVNESLITLFCWGIYFFLLSVIAEDVTLFSVNFPATHYLGMFFYTALLNNIMMAIYGALRKGIPKKKDFSKSIFLIFAVTTILFTVSWVVLNYGMTKGNPAIITPISSLAPVITITLGIIYYKEKLVTNQKIGIATILLGLVLISL